MTLSSFGAQRLIDDDDEEGSRDASSQHQYGEYTTDMRSDSRSVGSSSARSMVGYSTCTSSVGSSDISWKDDTFVRMYLNHIAASLKKHVEVKKSRRYLASLYKDCFVASEAVDFLLSLPNGVAPSRSHAVLLCQQLALTLQLFEHACEKEGGEESLKKEFADDYLLFHFVGMHSIGNVAFADVLRDYPDIAVSEDGGEGTLNLAFPQEWSSDDQWDNMSLAKLAMVLRQRVVTKDRRYRVSVYSKCFLGCEAVDVVLGANPATIHSRHHALLVLRRLNKAYQVFSHVCGDHDIKDEPLFYHFVNSITKSKEFDEEEYSFFAQTQSPWCGMAVAELEGMVSELKALSHDVTVDNNALSYNHNCMIRQDGTVMNEDQIRDLRKRHGYCESCPEDPIRLFVVRRSKFNPLYQKKEALFVPGQARNGICLLCNPPVGNTGGKRFKNKPRQSLATVAKVVKNTNSMMIPGGSMHSTQSHQSSITHEMSRRMSSSASVQSQESCLSVDTTGNASYQSGSVSSKASPVPPSSFSTSSGHRTKTPDDHQQHLSLLAAPKRHNSLVSGSRRPDVRPDLKRSNSVGVMLHSTRNKNDRSKHERNNSDDDMLSLFATPDTDTQLHPAEEESNYLHQQHFSKEDKSNQNPVSPTTAAMGMSVSSFECDAAFQALHTRRHMIAQAQKGDDLEQLMGAIRTHKSRSSSPRVDDYTTTMGLLSGPKQGISGSAPPAGSRSSSISSKEGELDEYFFENPTVLDRGANGGAALKDETSGGGINNRDGIPGSWIKLAQRTDDRLCALEAQVSLIVQQQNQQTLLMQQNTEMMQRLLIAVSGDGLSHSNVRQSSPLPLSRNDVAWRPLSHSNATNADAIHAPKSGMAGVSNTNSSAANAHDVSKGQEDKLPTICPPRRSHSLPQRRKNTSAPMPTRKQASQGDSRPKPSNPPEQIVSLPRRQSNQHPTPMGNPHIQHQQDQETLGGSGVVCEPNSGSQLTRSLSPKQHVSMPTSQNNVRLADIQHRKHPDPSTLTDQQPTGQNSCDDIALNSPETMMKQSDEMSSFSTRDAQFPHTMASVDETCSLTTWSEEDQRERKHKASKKKKKKKEKRSRASESGHRTDESPGVSTSPDSHSPKSLQKTLLGQQMTITQQTQGEQ